MRTLFVFLALAAVAAYAQNATKQVKQISAAILPPKDHKKNGTDADKKPGNKSLPKKTGLEELETKITAFFRNLFHGKDQIKGQKNITAPQAGRPKKLVMPKDNATQTRKPKTLPKKLGMPKENETGSRGGGVNAVTPGVEVPAPQLSPKKLVQSKEKATATEAGKPKSHPKKLVAPKEAVTAPAGVQGAEQKREKKPSATVVKA